MNRNGNERLVMDCLAAIEAGEPLAAVVARDPEAEATLSAVAAVDAALRARAQAPSPATIDRARQRFLEEAARTAPRGGSTGRAARLLGHTLVGIGLVAGTVALRPPTDAGSRPTRSAGPTLLGGA
ncbi:MAG: hypothetical protein KDH92_14895, partial [Chloroflexi bacterium]|nr:hypothetical protein [Chloroflexota bacterium]